MLFTSHVLGILVLSKVLRLEGGETVVAFISELGVDIDHLFVNKKWITDVKSFLKDCTVNYGVKQHSFFQEILFGAFLGILIGLILSKIFVEIHWWVFPLFLILHIVLDSVMHFEHQPFFPISKFKYWGWLRSGTKAEFILSTIGLLVLLLVKI